MKAVIQRVNRAICRVDGKTTGAIDKGLLVMLGVMQEDEKSDAELLAAKISKMRIFCDENDKMNLALNDVNGGILAISNFTLAANCSHGNRPDFFAAKKPEQANQLYEYFVSLLKMSVEKVETGVFGEHMIIENELNGPITIVLDSNELKRGKKG